MFSSIEEVKIRPEQRIDLLTVLKGIAIHLVLCLDRSEFSNIRNDSAYEIWWRHTILDNCFWKF